MHSSVEFGQEIRSQLKEMKLALTGLKTAYSYFSRSQKRLAPLLAARKGIVIPYPSAKLVIKTVEAVAAPPPPVPVELPSAHPKKTVPENCRVRIGPFTEVASLYQVITALKETDGLFLSPEQQFTGKFFTATCQGGTPTTLLETVRGVVPTAFLAGGRSEVTILIPEGNDTD